MAASHYIADERLNIARGHVKGTSVVHISGYNPQVDSNTDPETVWTHGGLYPWSALDAAHQLSITSTSVSDTIPVTISGLDNNFNPITETVTLTGTSAVQTTQEFRRVTGMYISNNVSNVGNIAAAVGASVVGYIAIGDGQTLNSCYTIPAGKTGYLYAGDCTLNGYNKDIVVRFLARYPGSHFVVVHVVCLAGGNYRYDFPFPMPLPAGTDLEVRVDEASDNGCKVTANYDILLINTPI